ncbi:MAG: BadF/BadG/BcrA/BcrD ATPase family protein [Thiolinea sp.]
MLPEDLAQAEPLRARFASCALVTDAYIACLGAHGGQDGCILITGTGSCAQVIAQGDSYTLGGWGLQLADQASGAWVGREAVRTALLAAEDILDHSPLTDQINRQFSFSPINYLQWSLEAKPADYAAFAPLVFQQAEQGDTHALAIVQEAARFVTRMIRMLAAAKTGRIALLGGLAERYPAMAGGRRAQPAHPGTG